MPERTAQGVASRRQVLALSRSRGRVVGERGSGVRGQRAYVRAPRPTLASSRGSVGSGSAPANRVGARAPVTEARGPVVAVLLAAGGASRLGRAKPLVRIGSSSLLERALGAASAGDETVLVLGAYAEVVRAAVDRAHRAYVVENADWASGMASSLRAGLAAVRGRWPAASALVVLTCDQPGVDRAHVARLIARHRVGDVAIVATEYAGGARVPAVFGRAVWPELDALAGDVGARAVLARDASRIATIPNASAALDLDTEEAIAELERRSQRP